VALRVWRARLEYREPGRRASWRGKLGYAIAIALACGALVRLPALWLSEDWYYPRLAPSLVILALGAYFWIERRTRRHLIAGLILALAAVGYVRLLPAYTDSVNMALIHLPVVFWAFLGLVFMGDSWRDADSRIRFLRYNGELVVLASLVALGGMVFSFVTVTLFELVSENIEERYFENVGVFGATAVPIAGTYLYDAVFGRRTGIAAVLARVFAPLFFVMAVTFLIVSFVGGQNPFIDRSFLITFNGLLLVVLSAILFRVVSFGFTPNRVVVLGANLIIIVHLGWICWTYVALARRRASLAALQRVVVGYLPVYVAWAAVVAFLLPLVFGFA
jgi:hypothetical protein